MKFRRRVRAMTRSEQARATLQATLDGLAEEGDPRAVRFADEIRDQPKSVDRIVAWAAHHIADSFGAWARFDPVIGAVAAYELAAHGVDLARAPSLDQRRRIEAAAVEQRLRDARDRMAGAASRAADRRALSNLAATRAALRKESPQ